MKNKAYKKSLSLILVLSVAVSCIIMPIGVDSVDLYEEPLYDSNNDSSLHAITTEDDYNNYGILTSASDVDW